MSSLLLSASRVSPIPKQQILDSSKLKEFAEDNSELMKTAERSLKGWKTLWEKEKLLLTSNFSFSHGVFKRLVLQIHKNKGLFGKGLKKVKIYFECKLKKA